MISLETTKHGMESAGCSYVFVIMYLYLTIREEEVRGLWGNMKVDMGAGNQRKEREWREMT